MKRMLLVFGLLFALCGIAFAAVNVNTATKAELDGLKGIGPAKAQAIIDYRTKNGPFKTVDDLEKVPGIGPKTLTDIRKDVMVTGATTKPTPVAEPAKAAAAPAKVDAKASKAAEKAADAKNDARKDAAKKDNGKDKK